MAADWAARVFAWFDLHGRHDLPWQHPRDPYRVWVSEIMLQQTTVATVIPYFQRFMQRFPTLQALAAAPADEVMARWSGLGYYARARNLHRSAQLIVQRPDGFPRQLEDLQQLPGIGRSTAGAILAQAFDQAAPILDGNVKRLLARHAGITGWPGQAAVLKQLWQLAERRLPAQRPADYAQALMDLGATICTRSQPRCELCPVAADCSARQQGLITEIPGRKPRKARPLRLHWYLLLRDHAGRILLQRRPPAGIWGGLWALPEAREQMQELESLGQSLVPEGSPLQHEFSHFSLQLQLVTGQPRDGEIRDQDELNWHTVDNALALGLPKPIRTLIETYCA